MNSTLATKERKIPLAIYALMVGAFGIGTTEFVIMGLLQEISRDFQINLSKAGMLISGYALGVAIGAPILSLISIRFSRKKSLIALMAIFTLGNLACALAPNYEALMIARILTSFAHGTFFGIGSVVATRLVDKDQKALAIALMFTGLTIANIAGVPFGTWLGQQFGWRSTFWVVTLIGPMAIAILTLFLPSDHEKVEVHLKQEIRALLHPQVLISLLVTIIGFSGVFAVFTYIAPILTTLAKFPKSAISPILMLFGLGLIFGNIVGGKLADKNLNATLIGSLTALVAVLGAFYFFGHSQIGVAILIGLLGFTGFATVAPLQMKVLESAGDAPTLASTLNIAAFNIGNALGAWVGGVVIDHGPGLNSISLIAALITSLGIGFSLFGSRFKSIHG